MDSATTTRPPRISLPAQAAFEIDTLGKELGSIAERLGCEVCISGESCVVVGFADVLDEPAAPERELVGV